MEHDLRRSHGIVAGLLLVAVLAPHAAQGQGQLDGLAAVYDGWVVWRSSSTDNDGTTVEEVIASIKKGRVSCDVAYTSPSHSAKTVGAGLFELSLGLKAEPPATGNAYSFRVACPDAEYSNGIRAAKWSHAMDSYQQPGGEVLLDKANNKLIPPGPLKGGWTEGDAGGTTTIGWFFCPGCTPPAAALPPP